MQIRPGAIAMLAGGVVLFISTLLDWVDIGGFFTENAYSGDFFGFTGIFVLVIALAVVAVAAIGAFAPQVSLPSEILGFRLNQVVFALGFAAFIWGFSLMVRDSSGFGVILAWIAGAAIAVGAILEDQAAAPATGAAPPRTF